MMMIKVLLQVVLFFVGLPVFGDVFSFQANQMATNSAAGKELTVLSGNAQVRSDTLFLKADRIELYGNNNQFIECIGHVTGREEEKEITFQTDWISYDRNSKVIRMEGDSLLEDKKNDVIARSRFIEYDDASEIAVFQVGVRLFKETMVCRSEYAVYRRAESFLTLSGFPVVYKQSDEFRADRIQVNLDTDEVNMEGSVSGSIKD
jgi:lipopolysaccharide export system protein LptA